MAIIKKETGYKWGFDNIGGCSRVRITKGEDIRHLAELDPKMWTVLSCPVKGLEIDEKSLGYIDADADGRIRISDVVSTSQWLCAALKNPDLILEGADSIDIEMFADSDTGRKLYNSAKQILANLSKEGGVISVADTADSAAIFAQTRFNGDGVITESSTDDVEAKNAIASAVASLGGVPDRSGAQGVNADVINTFYGALAEYVTWVAAAPKAPFGDQTDAVIEAYNALDAKVKDFFMRSRLAAFSPDSTSALDVQTSRIESISADNLAAKADDIASYPIARVSGKAEIDLSMPLNPAWAGKFEIVRAAALEGNIVTEADWNAVGARFAAYTAWKSSKAGAAVEGLGIDAVKTLLAQDKKAALLDLVAQDSALAEEAANIDLVDKFLHIYRDFYRLLRNFVTLNDFYNKDKTVGSIFQSGRLIIDQRVCRLCMRVADMAKHNASAATCGMFLIYCDCTSKTSTEKLNIVAAVTVGDVGDLIVGKNAVYYDNDGVEWDAVITKVIENPISISQAFWSPYRRMSKTIENLISKNAADKDAKMMAEANAKINAAPAALPAASPDGKPAVAPPFDIAKFAGIFAAIGVAMGMIGAALSGLVESLKGFQWYQYILLFAGIILCISGPSMVMAWLKLRRRNIAPLLNANGWAVNAASKISIPFGETLTDIAKFPKLKLKDPYRKDMAVWKKIMISIICLGMLLIALWIFGLFAFVGYPSPF
jgi:hypothetical protein